MGTKPRDVVYHAIARLSQFPEAMADRHCWSLVALLGLFGTGPDLVRVHHLPFEVQKGEMYESPSTSLKSAVFADLLRPYETRIQHLCGTVQTLALGASKVAEPVDLGPRASTPSIDVVHCESAQKTQNRGSEPTHSKHVDKHDWLYVQFISVGRAASHYHHLVMPEVVGNANPGSVCVWSIFKNRPGSREVMGRESPNLKATDSSLLQYGSPPRGTRVRIRPEGMVHVSTGSGGHMMSEARTPFSVCPCREDSQQQELWRPVKPRVDVVLGGLKRQREGGEVWGSHSEIRHVKLRSVAPEL